MQVSVQAASTVDPALARVLARLATAAELLGVTEVADLAAETASRLKTLRLEVAVVGEFKRGKSSLINALIGREVLPVGVLPLTAVPTVLEQGEDGLVVEFADGRQEHHPLRQVARFVTEEANPGNRLGVARVTARLHTPLVDAGVRLVDTPGVGSVHEHNTRSTDAYLPSLDAAVLVTSADPPISRAERAFLQRVLGTPCGCSWSSTRPTTWQPATWTGQLPSPRRWSGRCCPIGQAPSIHCRPDPASATQTACGGSVTTSAGSCTRSARRW